MMFFLDVVLSFLVALVVSNLMEWVSHKYFLHGFGKKKDSWFYYHWNHHNMVRKNKFLDKDYQDGFFKSSAVRREVFSLIGILLFNVNWLFIWPMLFFWYVFFTVAYYLVHSYSHVYPELTKKYLPWHYDHHMGTDQDKNWGVTLPLFDWILGTRVKYEYDEHGKVRKHNQ